MFDRRALRIADDLASLPLPPDHLWVRPKRQGSVWWLAAATAVVAVMLIVLYLPLAGRDERVPVGATGKPTVSPAATASVSPSANPAVPMPPFCTDGSPNIEVDGPSPPGPQPGTGAGTAEEAFRAAFPTVTRYEMIPFGSAQPHAPVWIVAGDETFIATYLGGPAGNNWFAYRARFVRCRSIEEIRDQPRGTRGPGPVG
jgi:hypothetical protein